MLSGGGLGAVAVALAQPWIRVGQVEKRLDSLGDSVKDLRTEVNKGFKELRDDMEELRADVKQGLIEVRAISQQMKQSILSKPTRQECVLGLAMLVAAGAVARSWQ